MVSLEPPEICDVGSDIATAVGKHQKCKVKSGVKLDWTTKNIWSKKWLARTTLKERQFVSENVQTMSNLPYILD